MCLGRPQEIPLWSAALTRHSLARVHLWPICLLLATYQQADLQAPGLFPNRSLRCLNQWTAKRDPFWSKRILHPGSCRWMMSSKSNNGIKEMEVSQLAGTCRGRWTPWSLAPAKEIPLVQTLSLKAWSKAMLLIHLRKVCKILSGRWRHQLKASCPLLYKYHLRAL